MAPDLNSDDDNPYDFIFKQDNPTPTTPAPKSAVGNKQMFIFAGFLVAVLIIVAIAISVITSSGKESGLEAIKVQAYQTEIERVIELGNKNTNDTALKNKIATIELNLMTDKTRVEAVLSGIGIAPSPLQVAQFENANRDTALTDSLQVDRHDEVYEEIIDELITEYYQALRAAEGAVTSALHRQTLTKIRTNIETIYDISQESSDEGVQDAESQQGDTQETAPAETSQ